MDWLLGMLEKLTMSTWKDAVRQSKQLPLKTSSRIGETNWRDLFPGTTTNCFQVGRTPSIQQQFLSALIASS